MSLDSGCLLRILFGWCTTCPWWWRAVWRSPLWHLSQACIVLNLVEYRTPVALLGLEVKAKNRRLKQKWNKTTMFPKKYPHNTPSWTWSLVLHVFARKLHCTGERRPFNCNQTQNKQIYKPNISPVCCFIYFVFPAWFCLHYQEGNCRKWQSGCGMNGTLSHPKS